MPPILRNNHRATINLHPARRAEKFQEYRLLRRSPETADSYQVAADNSLTYTSPFQRRKKAMRPPIPIPEERQAELRAFRKRKWAGNELQRFLCVWLRVKQGLNGPVIAKIIGWNVATVRMTQRDFIRRGVSALEEVRRGGRRRELMSEEEERAFLAGFERSGEKGDILVVNELKAALEKRVGRPVHKTTVYRMLHRHGWRKHPRRRHRKPVPEVLEDFKKGASQDG
ncbi:MAG: winged helix-turn-helix domain-containing protein [Candidatus Accumulibacter sp.]|nr:winged helix-turn-helix domain-containing protein [Accumulibacter sp.]